MAEKRLREVRCNEACFACQVGNHEKCENVEECECTHLKEEPIDWREKLRKRFPILFPARSSRKNPS
jgi:hypothetical protein